MHKMKHNSPEYIHTLTEAIKLTMADRDCYYSVPRFVEVPMDSLLSKAYAETRAGLISHDKAWGEMPPAGDWSELGLPHEPPVFKPQPRNSGVDGAALDTTYLCVVDNKETVFSTTPNTGSYNETNVPRVNFMINSQDTQS